MLSESEPELSPVAVLVGKQDEDDEDNESAGKVSWVDLVSGDIAVDNSASAPILP